MTEILNEIRKIQSLDTAIISSVSLIKSKNSVEVCIVTDKSYSAADEAQARKIVRKFVPDLFAVSVKISKLTPDCDMVKKKIFSLLSEVNRQLAAFVTEGDIRVEKTDDGFCFEIAVIHASAYSSEVAEEISARMSKNYCGNFRGKCVDSKRSLDDYEVEESHENIQYEIPVRTFEIRDFEFLESTAKQTTAVYLADLNFLSESVAVCGTVTDIRERQITNSAGKERTMFNFTVTDTTATLRISYFARQKSIEKIRKIKVGDSIVLTCKTDVYNGMVRPTANFVDFGKIPENFVPEKRVSKPVPKYYETVFPEPYSDFTQGDFFTDKSLPACLTENTFVVFDLETTGLNSSPSAGNMDAIIEIGAYKIIGGEIKESFTTFVNPERKLSDEIVALTGIDQTMVASAPKFAQVMPDFFKFIDGAYLVGHNAANFDYKFIEYYCSKCGYQPERKIFDTIPLSQELLRLSNYKLNTVADHFGIKFNHHRAIDDALVTAKIFIELIKIKKSLPNLC